MALTKVSYSMISGAPVNVLDFGSTGAAFQAAIDSLPASGGRIVVPDGTTMTISSTLLVNKPLELILGACTLTFTAAIGIEHTSPNFIITGAGDSTSIIQHSGANHCIYSHGSSSPIGAYLARVVIENVGLTDLLTTQTTSQFATWSTTRTAGAGIYSTTVHTSLKNINVFGFFDGVRATGILACAWESLRSVWSARDGLHLGAASTSVTMTGCYAFAPQRDGIRLEDNAWYCTLNSTASDAAGRYAYYFGPGEINGLSPFNITLNSIGCEESGYLNTAGASIFLEAVKNIIFNSPLITGFGTRLANTVSGIYFAGAASSNVSINMGQIGFAASELGGYGLYVPTGTYAGKLTIVGQPAYATTSTNVSDTDNVIEYLQGNQPDRTTFQATESTSAGATPTYLNSFFDVLANNSISTYKVTITCRQTAGTGGTVGQGAAYVFYRTIRVIGGTPTYIGATVYAMTVENDATWNADLVVDSGGARLIVTGAVDQTISWQYSIDRSRV